MNDDELERFTRQFVKQMENTQTAFGVLTALCASSAPMQVDVELRTAAVHAAIEGRGVEGIVSLIDGLATVAYLGFQRAAALEGRDRPPLELIREEAADVAKLVDDGNREIGEKYKD